MQNLLSSLQSPGSGMAPVASAPPLSLGSPGIASFTNIPGNIKSLKNLGGTNSESSNKLKITSWLLFVISLIYSIIFA